MNLLLRILAIHGAKIIPPGTFCLVWLLNNQAKHVRGSVFSDFDTMYS